jgi:serine/threonine-protein kinase
LHAVDGFLTLDESMDAGIRSGSILLGKYRIEGMLGRDGMCIVLAVSHVQFGGELALKMLQPETGTSLSVQARFLQEAQLAGRLRGEHVARVVDVGIMPDGAPYMVTEAVRGIDLANELARRGQLPPSEAVDYLLQACEALAEAHAQGIIHRYICPTNVLLTARPDGTALVKVLDFGVSKTPVSGSPVMRAEMSGAPGYRAPEQRRVSAELDARTDLWSLGIVLYECLSGCHPFPTEPPAAAGRAAMTETPRPMDPRIPRELQAIVLRCLESDREARFPTVAALAAALAPFSHDRPAAAMLVERVNLISHGVNGVIDLAPTQIHAPIVIPPSADGRSPSRRYAVIASVALAVTLLGIGIVALARRDTPRNPIDTIVAARTHEAAGTQKGATPRPLEGTSGTNPSGDNPSANPSSANPSGASPTGASKLPSADGPHPAAATRSPSADNPSMPTPTHSPSTASASPTRVAAVTDADKKPKVDARTMRAEVQNDRVTERVRQALRDGDLRAAQSGLRQLSPGAAYYAWLRDEVSKAETERADEARGKAHQLASAHDCAGLRRFVGELRSTGTEKVIAAAQAVSCDEPGAPEHSAPKPAAPERIASKAGAPESAAIGVPQPRSASCESVDVEDVMTRAAIQYDAGAASSALSLARVALGCKQTDRMYWLTVMYACAAHDLASAKRYFPKVPTNLQSGIESKCQKQNLDVRSR